MSKKHEDIKDENLIYCFVLIENADRMPKFFLVPSKAVSEYVRWQHEYWISTRKSVPNDTTMRKFRIELDDPDKYFNNWDILSEKQHTSIVLRQRVTKSRISSETLFYNSYRTNIAKR